jgi:hypothetical protein
VFNENSTFRCSDRHAVPQMVLVSRVVVTYRRHRPRHRQRQSWQHKPKCCARFYRHNNRWPNNYNRCNRCNRSLDPSSLAHPDYLPRLIWIPLSVRFICWKDNLVLSQIVYDIVQGHYRGLSQTSLADSLSQSLPTSMVEQARLFNLLVDHVNHINPI